jgi:hypothetical protein
VKQWLVGLAEGIAWPNFTLISGRAK